MQPAERSPRRTALWLTLGVVALVVLAAGTTAVFLVSRQRDTHPAPGDVALTLRAYGDGGATPSAAMLDRTRQMLLDRMHAAGLTRPTATRIGTDALLVTAGPRDGARARSLLTQGNLTFRRVLQSMPARPGTGTPSGCPATPTDHADLAPVKAKLGAQWDVAAQIQDPTRADPETMAAFGTLTCTEVGTLPAQMQFMVPTVSCDQLNGRGPDALSDNADAVVACDGPGTTKYALDVPRLAGSDIHTAVAENDPQQGGWLVRVRFRRSGRR
jgi:preprotein translocase subunit SecD